MTAQALMDLDLFLMDDLFASDVVFSGLTFRGILDSVDEFLSSGIVISTQYTLTAKQSDVSVLEPGDVLTIDGTDYNVNSVSRIDDGGFARLGLSKV